MSGSRSTVFGFWIPILAVRLFVSRVLCLDSPLFAALIEILSPGNRTHINMHRNHSFETIESCSLDSETLAQLRASGGEGSSQWVSNPYSTTDAVVSDNEEEEERLEETGILIVSPEDNHPEEQHQSTLTIPESLPSNVGSLRMSGVHQRQAVSSSSGSVDSLQKQSKLSTRLSVAIALICFATLCLSPAFYMMRERQEIRSVTERLQEEIRVLSEQLETTQQEQQKRASSTTNLPRFHWEEETTKQSTCSEPSSRIDNCWVHAEAQFELGACAHKTKKKLKKGLHKLGKGLWHVQEEFQRAIKEQYTETANRFKAATDRSATEDTDGTGGEDDDAPVHVRLPAVKPKERMQNLGKATTKFLSGVAFASAAAIVVSAAFVFGENEED